MKLTLAANDLTVSKGLLALTRDRLQPSKMRGRVRTFAIAIGYLLVSKPCNCKMAIDTEDCCRHKYIDVKEVLFRIEPIWVSIYAGLKSPSREKVNVQDSDC
jgi:hypothetical protein